MVGMFWKWRRGGLMDRPLALVLRASCKFKKQREKQKILSKTFKSQPNIFKGIHYQCSKTARIQKEKYKFSGMNTYRTICSIPTSSYNIWKQLCLKLKVPGKLKAARGFSKCKRLVSHSQVTTNNYRLSQ